MKTGTQQRPAEERFWERVDASGDCWEWTGSKNNAGYGNFSPGQGQPRTGAHRFVWELMIGPIPEGHVIDHLCRNPACVNPDHLQPVTYAENSRRGYSPISRQRYMRVCQRGHEMTGANVGIQGPGWRYCKACVRMRAAIRKAA